MISCVITSNNRLIIEITDGFADKDLNSIFLLLESLIDDYTHTNVYFKIESNLKKQVNQKIENTRYFQPYHICYLPQNNTLTH